MPRIFFWRNLYPENILFDTLSINRRRQFIENRDSVFFSFLPVFSQLLGYSIVLPQPNLIPVLLQIYYYYIHS